MKIENLNNMVKGWFVGNFEPTLLKTNDVECAVKTYRAGDYEEPHYHKIATEITVVINGIVKMKDIILKAGDIILLEPNEVTDFTAITDSICTVVKFPGASDDKYLV